MDTRHRIRFIAAAVAVAALTGGRAVATTPPLAPDEITDSFIDAVNEQFGEDPQDVECFDRYAGYDCIAWLDDGSRLDGTINEVNIGPDDTWTIERTETFPDTDLGRAAEECDPDLEGFFTFYDDGLSVGVYDDHACMVRALGIPEWVGVADSGEVLTFGDWSVFWALSILWILDNEVAPGN